MYLCAPDKVVQRLLPVHNPDAEDRACAWNEWLTEGGSEPVKKFIRWTNGTTTDDDEILQETLIIAYVKVEHGHTKTVTSLHSVLKNRLV
jgi:DNA-directed RNA polymerase specialized sigma24 family protein